MMKKRFFLVLVLSFAQSVLLAMEVAKKSHEVSQELAKVNSEVRTLIDRRKTKMNKQALHLTNEAEGIKTKLVRLQTESDEAEIQCKLFDQQTTLEHEEKARNLVVINLRLAALRQLSNGELPLHVAVRYGNLSLLQKLLVAKPNCNCVDAMGRSPLHYAVERLERSLIELLLSSGAHASLKDQQGFSCIDLIQQLRRVSAQLSLEELDELETLLHKSLCCICFSPLHPLEDAVRISREHCQCMIHGQCREALFEDRNFKNACPVCKVEIPKEVDECAICQEEFTEEDYGVVGINCTHRLHAACQRSWVARKNECPTCKQALIKNLKKK